MATASATAGSSSRWRIRPWPSRPTSMATPAVAQHAAITFIRPGRVGETLVAEAVERMRAGRSGMYDVRVSTAARRACGGVPRPHAHAPRTAKTEATMAGLDPIETASRDEIAALQTRAPRLDAAPRLYATCRIIAPRSTPPVCIPTISARWRTWRNSRSPPSRTCAPTIRSACSPCRGSKLVRDPCLVRHHGQADRRRLYARGSRHLGAGGGALDLRRRRAAGDDPAQRLWLRAVHRRAGPARRRGTPGLHRGAGLRRHDRAPGAAHRRLPPRHHHASRRATCWRSWTSSAARASIRAHRRCRIGIFGAEPWTNAMRREIEAGFAHGCRRHLRLVGSDGAGRRQRMHRDQGRPAHLGGSLLSRGHRSGHRCRAAGRRARASWCSPR